MHHSFEDIKKFAQLVSNDEHAIFSILNLLYKEKYNQT